MDIGDVFNLDSTGKKIQFTIERETERFFKDYSFNYFYFFYFEAINDVSFCYFKALQYCESLKFWSTVSFQFCHFAALKLEQHTFEMICIKLVECYLNLEFIFTVKRVNVAKWNTFISEVIMKVKWRRKNLAYGSLNTSSLPLTFSCPSMLHPLTHTRTHTRISTRVDIREHVHAFIGWKVVVQFNVHKLFLSQTIKPEKPKQIQLPLWVSFAS